MAEKHSRLNGAGAFRKAALASAFALSLGLLCIQKAPAEKPIDWDKKLEKGYHELSIGNVDESIKWFQAKVKSYPQSGACHTALGMSLKKKGRLAEAKSEFRQATEVDSSYAEGFYELGAMMESDKEYEGAAQAFEKYLVLKPESNRRTAVADRIRFCKDHQ